ncbi:MAG: HAD family hydrolase [Opitutaceae bacterium]|nr:HAD family hydrolase [Opitutaceae bacterium]
MTPRRAPRVAVFDFDGTLIDSLPLVLAAITHAVEGFGPRPTKEIFATLGGPPERFLVPLLHDPGDLPVALERLMRFHRENSHLMEPFAGADAVLEALAMTGVPVALWTGRDRHSTARLLGLRGWTERFAAIVCGDDFASHKPEPEGLQAILARIGVPASEAILVGDSDVDVLGGAAAGVDTVLIAHGRAVPPVIAARAWCIVASPPEAYASVLHMIGGAGKPTG